MGNTACVSDRKDTDCSLVSNMENEAFDEAVQDKSDRTSWVKLPSLMRNARSRADSAESCADSGLQTGDFHIEDADIDLAKKSLKSQLLSKLGLSSDSTVKRLSTDQCGVKVAHGFNNTGLWTIAPKEPGASPQLVVKLVRSALGESTKFQKLESEFPEIGSDPLLAFPSHAFRCITPHGEQPLELIAMRKARGMVLHDFVVNRLQENQTRNLPSILALFGKVGVNLADFHARYRNKQHSDFQPTNIIYDETSGKIVFIDIANMGCHLNRPGSDVQQFRASIQALYSRWGSSLAQSFEQSFITGYGKKH